jgi:hypothetical protein
VGLKAPGITTVVSKIERFTLCTCSASVDGTEETLVGEGIDVTGNDLEDTSRDRGFGEGN